MKKALVVATVIGFIANFEMNDILLLQGMGYEVHIAAEMSDCNNKEKLNRLLASGVITHDIHFSRNPFKIGNIKAFKELLNLAKKERFDLLHCHTPVGGVFGRAVGHFTGVKQVIYTAHGFHFFKGAPLKNWLLYYPIEKFCSRWADIQITINNEDYLRAKTFHTKKVKRIHGIGIDIERFKQNADSREIKREELGIARDDIVLLSVGQLHPDKNQRVVLEALKELDNRYKYYICGVGDIREELEAYIDENALVGRAFLLGYRMDIPALLQAADVYVFPSLFEGLSVALMEAVAAKIPIACSKVRGNVDTVVTEESYFSPKRSVELVSVIKKISTMSPEEKDKMTEMNYHNLLKYQISEVRNEMTEIYGEADTIVEERKQK